MSKKIDAARKELEKALRKHADAVGGDAVSLKKSQRATAGLLAAAEAYSAVVTAKTGAPDPFAGLSRTTGLEESTISSLKAERNKIKDRVTGPIPIQDTFPKDDFDDEGDDDPVEKTA